MHATPALPEDALSCGLLPHLIPEYTTDRRDQDLFSFFRHYQMCIRDRASILSMMPGIGNKAADIEAAVDESKMARIEAIILSMTPKAVSYTHLLRRKST